MKPKSYFLPVLLALVGGVFIAISRYLAMVKGSLISGAATQQLEDGFGYAAAQTKIAAYDTTGTILMIVGVVLCLWLIFAIGYNIYVKISKANQTSE